MTHSTLAKSFVCAMLLVSFAIATHSAHAASPGYHTAAEIRAAWNDMKPTPLVDKYTVRPQVTSPVSAGALNPAFVSDGLKMANFARYLAYLPADLVVNSELSRKAQWGALALASNDELTHGPARPAGFSDAQYADARNACGTSNIGSGHASLSDAVHSFLCNDTSLSTLGHRRWILNPALKNVGFGYAPTVEGVRSYTVMPIFDGSGAGTADYVAWPTRGAFPVEYMKNQFAWSISLDTAKYDPKRTSEVRVSIKELSGGQQWSPSGADFAINTEYYGVNYCVMFRPSGVTYREGQRFEVTISGIYRKDGAKVNLTYTVEPVALIPVPVISMVPSENTVTVKLGATKQLGVTITPSNATDRTVYWKSLDPAVVGVSSTGLLTANGLGTTLVYVACGNKTSSVIVTVNAPVTGVKLPSATRVAYINERFLLTPTISPANATNPAVTWSSSNTAVATVDAEGRVSPIAAGTAVITVTTKDGGFTARCTVTVQKRPVTSVTLTPASAELYISGTLQLKHNALPGNATYRGVTYSTSSSAVASVTSAGLVTALKAGTATITVTTVDGGYKATCAVTVRARPTTGVTVSAATKTVYLNEKVTITAAVQPVGASTEVTWLSSAPTIASVSSAGVVTGLKEGTATITVTTKAGGFSAKCVVTSKRRAVTGVTMSPTTLSLNVNGTSKLTSTIAPGNATIPGVAWKSSNTAVATVDGAGTVKGVGAGTATITVTASDGGFKATCAVTVKRVPVTGVTLTLSTAKMYPGDTCKAVGKVTPSNATNQAVTYLSSKTAVARVSSTGVVTAYAVGTAVITAKSSDGGYTSKLTVTVVPTVTSLSVPSKLTVSALNYFTIPITSAPALQSPATYTTQNAPIVQILNGRLYARAAGTSVITIRAGGKTVTCLVTVK